MAIISSMVPSISVSAPGRLCLFGEHQDYFGLPVITAAVNLRISVCGTARNDSSLVIHMPDTAENDEIILSEAAPYHKKRDYLRSAVNILRRSGVILPHGWDCTIKGEIPLNSGTASSSALVVAWIRFLLEAAGDKRKNSLETIAEWAYQAEVKEFDEPGGKMDHAAASWGGIIAVRFFPELKITILKSQLKEFVLADSGNRKDTTGTLSRIKNGVLDGLKRIQEEIPDFQFYSPRDDRFEKSAARIPEESRRLLSGTLETRDLTREGLQLFLSPLFDHRRFGDLLLQQQRILREDLRISGPVHDSLIDTACSAGALGAKINGSGDGGCIFAYAPGKEAEVAEALKRKGARTYFIQPDSGVKKHHKKENS